jgi:predicted AAA+ superfamily ATPase
LANAAATGECELFYWREGDREVDFVLRAGNQVVAIEVKTSSSSSVPSGLGAFVKAFKPNRTLLVGPEGISLEDFLLTPVRYWFEEE